MAPGGSWWPSLGWASLPSFDSFTTRHWQRRLLRYLIKRALTGFLRIPEDDIEQSTYLDADLGSGSVKLRDVELDQEAINNIISQQLGDGSPVDVCLQSSSISSVQILVGSSDTANHDRPASEQQSSKPLSATERLFTAPIHIIAKAIVLDFRINPRQASARAHESKHNAAEDEEMVGPTLDLGASILHVAEEYIHEDQIDVAEVSESLDESFGLPGGFEASRSDSTPSQPALSEQQQVGLIAKVIETLLERLQISVSNVTLNLAMGEDLKLQLRLVKLETSTEVKITGQSRSQIRSLEVEGLNMYHLAAASARQQTKTAAMPEHIPGSPTNSSSVSTGSSDDLAMSMAIADLRTSETGETHLLAASSRSTALEGSVYLDAESDDDTKKNSEMSTTQEQPRTQHDVNTHAEGSHEVVLDTSTCHILGLFRDSSSDTKLARIRIRLVTTISISASPSTQHDSIPQLDRLLQSSSHRIEISLPVLALSIDASLFRSTSAFLSRLPPSAEMKSPHKREIKCQESTLLHIRMRTLHIFGHLDDSSESLTDLVKLFSEPTTEAVPQLIYFYLKTVEGVLRLDLEDAKLAIHDFGICSSRKGTLQPVLLPDPGLIWQYDPDVLRPGEQIHSFCAWPLKNSHRLRNWLCSLPAGTNSMTASTRLPMLKDALAARLKDGGLDINMQPLHLWLDAELVDELAQMSLDSGILDALSTATSSKPEKGQTPSSNLDESKYALSLTTPCIRVDLKCPTLASADDALYGGLRCGIVTLALHDVTCRSARQTSIQPTSLAAESTAGLAMASAFLFLAEPAEMGVRIVVFAGQNRLKRPVPIRLLFYDSSTSQSEHDGLKLQVPSLEIELVKKDIDALQYLVDDLTRLAGRFVFLCKKDHTSAVASQDATAVSEPANKSSSFPIPRSTPGDASGSNLAEVGGLVELVKIRLQLSSKADLTPSRSLEIEMRALSVNVDLRQNGNDKLVLDTAIKELMVVNVTSTSEVHEEMTLLQTSSDAQVHVLQLRLVSSVNEKLLKQTSISLKLSSATGSLSSDAKLSEAFMAFIKVPPGAFLDVAPTDITNIDFEGNRLIVKLVARTLPPAVALFTEKVSLKTTLKQGAVCTKCTLSAQSLQAWISDTPRDEEAPRSTLKDLGYAQMLQCSSVFTVVKAHAAPLGTMFVSLDLGTTHVTACPDTILCLSSFAGDFFPPAEPKARPDNRTSAGMSGSIIQEREALLQPPQPSPSAAYPGELVSVVDGESIQIFGQGKLGLDRTWLYDSKLHARGLEKSPSPSFSLKLKPSELTISFFEGYDFDSTRTYIKSTVKATRRKLEKIKQLLAEGQVPEQTIEEVADPLLQSVFLPSRSIMRTRGKVENHDLQDTIEEMDTLTRIVAFDDELDQDDEYESDSLLAWEALPDRPAAPRRGSSSSSRIPLSRPSRSNRLSRPRSPAIDIHLSGIGVDLHAFPEESSLASRVLVQIKDVSIVDNIKTSTWNKFLTELRPRDGGITRPTGSPMVRVVLRMLRSGETGGNGEADLSVKVAPLRLHVDQDALDFLKAFFAFKLDPALLDVSKSVPAALPESHTKQDTEGGFVQRVEISAIKIKLDYKPKRVDYHALRQGRAIEMMNFFHFEASEMVLRHLVLSGVPNWAKVGDMLQEIWTPDVKANQLADFLAGINPVRSVVNVGHGVADLVLLPMAQYKKDGRLSRGLQRGGTRFAKSTAMEAIKLGARLATGTQVILEHAEHVLGGRIEAPSIAGGSRPASTSVPTGLSRSEWLLTTAAEDNEDDEDLESSGNEPLSKFSQQPEDVKIGLQTAYKSLSGNVRSAAETILAVPMEVYERSSDGAVRAVVRAVPIAVLKPMIGASEAVSKTLLGLRNTLDPGAREEVEDKYKRR